MQFAQLKRRQLIKLLGNAAAWPVAARAQGRLPTIGFLSSQRPKGAINFVAAFRSGLAELGYKEGQNAQIEFRWAEDQHERLPRLAAELVQSSVTALVTSGGTVTALAAKAVTATIPIVFTIGGDPVTLGLVVSLNRPGANITGVSFLSAQLDPKLLELLGQVVPKSGSIGVLANPKNPNITAKLGDMRMAGRALGRELVVAKASTEDELEAAFRSLVEQRAGGVLVDADPFNSSRRAQIATLAVRHALPSIYWAREYAEAGGLMSYGASYADTHRQVGAYVGRILNGAKPSELPVLQPVKFELTININTAKALGLMLPSNIVAIADEVIE